MLENSHLTTETSRKKSLRPLCNSDARRMRWSQDERRTAFKGGEFLHKSLRERRVFQDAQHVHKDGVVTQSLPIQQEAVSMNTDETGATIVREEFVCCVSRSPPHEHRQLLDTEWKIRSLVDLDNFWCGACVCWWRIVTLERSAADAV